jgi:Transglutaminase elicitor
MPMSRKAESTAHVYNYILEMDGRGTILGGEWIVSPSAEGPNNKDMHPDFLFMSIQPEATSEGADDRNGRVDNPYLSSVHVRELLRISQTPQPMTP